MPNPMGPMHLDSKSMEAKQKWRRIRNRTIAMAILFHPLSDLFLFFFAYFWCIIFIYYTAWHGRDKQIDIETDKLARDTHIVCVCECVYAHRNIFVIYAW